MSPRERWVSTAAALVAGLAVFVAGGDARAVDWSAAVASGVDAWLAPETNLHGWALFDLRGRGAVGRGDFHAYFNTDTLYAGVENVPMGTDALQFSAAVRAEALFAGVLRSYYRDARRVSERGFDASYAQALASVKWLPGGPHSVELVVSGRRWFFGHGGASRGLTLPDDPWVFEPRLRYTFWRVTSPADEWQAQVMFPRITGLAAGVELGADLRSDARAWGAIGAADDGRNRPGDAILTARQWLRAGAQVSPRLRVQFEESASWGEGEDDLTRVRVGGMNPYVVPIPGLPWPALLCERLVAAQASLHVRPSLRAPHELGVAVSGGAFNDVLRTGALGVFDGAGGVALFADLRFGRFQVNARVGYAFPAAWLSEPPHVSALLGLGARLF